MEKETNFSHRRMNSMIHDFTDFCLHGRMIVDDACVQIKRLVSRPGPEPGCSDSEPMGMCIIGECRGWDVESELFVFTPN